jgi:EAL domain-containing protein (putative c-di-GMP-specific phosphodiesterase class I)
MEKRVHKVAILHRDDAIIARVTRLAKAAGLDIVRPLSFAAFAASIDDPLLSAIVTDAPRDQLERLHSPSSHAAIIVIAELDPKSADAAHRLASAGGFELALFQPQTINDAELTRQLCRGRDRAPIFGPAEIDACLENHHFTVEYQPKVSLLSTSTASQFGVEALCRMKDPRFGVISPDLFIPMAESCGLIAKLTDAVACEAFRAWQTWNAAGLCLRLALNVSPALLGDADWAEKFLGRCTEFKVEPKWITLEITETAAGATNPKATEILTRLQQKGFALSIDDFGTGFSSLATLYRLPIAEMKIDKSFILDLQGTAGARDLVESAIGMAKRMGVKVVAEGLESQNVFEELRRIGCHEVQGFFVGRSMAADKVVAFFTGWRKTHQDAPSADAPVLPKIAILQALLNDIVSDRSLETLAAPQGPYRVQAARIETGSNPKDLVRKLPALILAGKTLPALALCHDAVRQLQSFPACNDMRAKVGQLQSHLEQELTTRADLELYSPQGMFRLLPREAVSLGRPSASSRVDIPVKCRWFSSGDKNLRIFASAGQWFLEDMGSGHGYIIDGRRLSVRRPFALALGQTRVEVRLTSGAVAPLSLLVRRTALNPDAVTISFDYHAQNLRRDLGEKDWLEVEPELDCTWIVFNGKISLGRLSDCALALEDCAWPTAATIYFNRGYWIAPLVEAGLAMDDTVFHQDLPLAAKSELKIGECRLIIREAVREDSAPAKARAFG